MGLANRHLFLEFGELWCGGPAIPRGDMTSVLDWCTWCSVDCVVAETRVHKLFVQHSVHLFMDANHGGTGRRLPQNLKWGTVANAHCPLQIKRKLPLRIHENTPFQEKNLFPFWGGGYRPVSGGPHPSPRTKTPGFARLFPFPKEPARSTHMRLLTAQPTPVSQRAHPHIVISHVLALLVVNP